MKQPLSLMQLGRLEQRLADLLGAKVDLVPESALRPDIAERVTSEAVELSVGRRQSCRARHSSAWSWPLSTTASTTWTNWSSLQCQRNCPRECGPP